MVEAQGLIANVMTANVDELELRDKWYFQGIRVGTHTVDFLLNPCVQDHQLPSEKMSNSNEQVSQSSTAQYKENVRVSSLD